MPFLSLSDAIAAVPGWPAPAVLEIEVLAGGTTNRSWRVVAGEEAFVLRLPRPSKSANPIADPYRELEIANTVAAAGIGPAVYHAAPASGLLVTRFVTGGTPSFDSAARRETLVGMGRTLAKVHALPAPANSYSLDDALSAWQRRSRSPERAGEVIDTARQIMSALPTTPRTLCHGDPVRENFVQGERWWLLDWEYARAGDPLFDLAAVAAHHKLDDADIQCLLEAHGSGGSLRPVKSLMGLYDCFYWLWQNQL